MSIAASEEGLLLSDAEDSADPSPLAVTVQSKYEALFKPVLFRFKMAF